MLPPLSGLEWAFLKSQSQGLLKRPYTEPGAGVVAVHTDATTAEGQVVRSITAPRVST